MRRTGALMADVRFAPDGARGEVGNTLAYAPLVHGGTTRLPARPYLAQALLSGVPRCKAPPRRSMMTADPALTETNNKKG